VSLKGPQGAGKSAALFLLVSAWRSLRREGVRVTYVQDAAEWVASHDRSPFEFLLCELLYTFLGEVVAGKRIEDMCREVASLPKEAREAKFKDVIDSLVAHVQ
jgi:hypothetical protein